MKIIDLGWPEGHWQPVRWAILTTAGLLIVSVKAHFHYGCVLRCVKFERASYRFNAIAMPTTQRSTTLY